MKVFPTSTDETFSLSELASALELVRQHAITQANHQVDDTPAPLDDELWPGYCPACPHCVQGQQFALATANTNTVAAADDARAVTAPPLANDVAPIPNMAATTVPAAVTTPTTINNVALVTPVPCAVATTAQATPNFHTNTSVSQRWHNVHVHVIGMPGACFGHHTSHSAAEAAYAQSSGIKYWYTSKSVTVVCSKDNKCPEVVAVSADRQKAHQQTKRVYYLWWRQRQGATNAMLSAFETLDEMFSRTYTGGSRNHNGCQDRVGAVLQDIDAQGWSIVRPEFLEEVSEATTLLKDTEDLSMCVAKLEGPCTAYLKTESRLWLAAEEQILSLMDQEPGALEHALFNDGLSKGYRQKLNKYDCQFIAENTARHAAEVKRRHNDDTQDGAPPGRLSEAFNFDVVDEAYVEFLVDTTTDMEPIKAKRKHTAGDKPQKLWIPEREKFLREFIRLEGRGDTMLYQTCQGLPGCPNEAIVHCRDCEGLQLYCQGCRVMQHTATPLHHMEIWTGVMCCNPASAFDDDFTVLEINGIHSVTLNFSTTTNPWTAATFHLLDHFQMYTFESKGSAFKYYQSLSHLTDNIGTCQPKPGRNLPQDWENAPSHVKWLYGLFLAIDANFQLCRHNKASDQADPSLGNGWAYFVEQTGFKEVLDASSGQLQEKSSCASHNAVNLADTKSAQGMAATGVGAVVCAQHNPTRPSAVGDLQKGEKYLARYVNMDYLFFSTLQHASDIHVLNISYDIACQWSKHLWTRMSWYPSRIHLQPDNKVITFIVPKFHLPVHILSCQTTYSINLIKGMARTDGEAIECDWSNINLIATSTWEMGPGSRHDILDDHFGDWNWRKVCNLGPLLLCKLKQAIHERDQHVFNLRDFEEAIPPASLAAWQVMITEWEQDRSKPNPFELEALVATQASVRLELSQLEGQQLSHGVNTSLHPDVSLSVLVAVGIDLESLQWRLAIDSTNIGAHCHR
ncbi:hypothetical protein F4604DRAFT_1688751 [Suillus subluteus]|nr:hypothetical protein F4604DRAFT_1688751 [Suillus subluteus]